jgi:hypothetical protein
MAPLEAAYASAVYRIETDPPVAFTFASPALAALPCGSPKLPSGFWTIITAYNPGRCTFTSDANSLRNVSLRCWLDARRLAYLPTTSHDDKGDHCERGFLVHGMARELSLVAARAFEQRAVVFGHGGTCGLLFPRTDRWVIMPLKQLPEFRRRV